MQSTWQPRRAYHLSAFGWFRVPRTNSITPLHANAFFSVASQVGLLALAFLDERLACARSENGEKSIPRILIIGDSISIGYTQPLKELFKGEAEVHHNPGNAQHSGHGLAHLEAWLGDAPGT